MAGFGIEDGLRHPFAAVAGFLVPDCTLLADRRGASVSVWLYGLSDLSWAAAVLTDGVPQSTVFQSGPRRLWDELSVAYRWWDGMGQPEIRRFGLTVDGNGESIWLDDPARPVRQ
ncbi:hypothetical protein [Streptomyces sp. NPDC047315]|uniref:hypothetical protein n=1 Tax=Streptomyces sp. NPDC047315 TaxID=3155142 RepID=UPI0033D1EBA3